MRNDTMNHILRPVLAGLLAALVLASPSLAHEGHKQDMTDAEMVQMEAEMAQMGTHEAIDQSQLPAETAQSDAKTVVTMPHGGNGHAGGSALEAAATLSAEQTLAAQVVKNRLTSSNDLLGRLHPVAAHFPIALLLVAALAELALMIRPTLGLPTTIRFLVASGAIGAVAAALLGWFAAGWRLTDRSETLGLHRWNGTAIAVISLIAWWFAIRGDSRRGLRVTLALLAAALLLQGYLGGEMVFGPNHMGIR